jgi:hypothetical protein
MRSRGARPRAFNVAVAPARTRPLIAVLSRVPLFVEALRAAFEGIADVQSVSADDVEAHGLIRAFHPDAVIIEGAERDAIGLSAPCVWVELSAERVSIRSGDNWELLDVPLSPEAIRNVAVAALYGGDPA